MADTDLRAIQDFWDHLYGKSTTNGRPSAPKYGKRQRRNQNQGSHRNLGVTKNGHYKSYMGADVPKTESRGNYVLVPNNDLNIMDYVAHMGIPYYLNDRNNGAQYELGVSSARESQNRNRKKGDTPYDSISVGLHPQVFYDKNGKPKRDKNGKLVLVTARGGFNRFSEPDSGQGKGGDPLIRFIRDVNHMDTREAYQELGRFIESYGTETHFDPLDSDMPLPRSSNGDITHAGNQFSASKRTEHPKHAPNKIDMGRYYHGISALGRFKLFNVAMGKEARQRLKDLGYTPQQIRDEKIGWFPSTEQEAKLPKKQRLPYFLAKIYHGNLGIPIHSRVFKVEQQGRLVNRMAGQFIKPITNKSGKTLGIQTYDQNMRPKQKLQTKGQYSDNPLGSMVTEKNPEFRDNGRTFNRTDKAGRDFAKGYLHGKRGISEDVVDHLMDRGYLRVGLGMKPDSQAQQKAEKIKHKEDELRKPTHRDAYIQKAGTKVYQEEWEDMKSLNDPQKLKEFEDNKDGAIQNWGQDKYKKELNYLDRKRKSSYYKGRGFPSYIEFPQRLSGQGKSDFTQDKLKELDDKGIDTKDYREPVGADRIYFDPAKSDYTLDPNHGQRGKMVERNSMQNYGFNIPWGHKSPSKKRDLYVFEDPIDAISYLDMHRGDLNLKGRPSDILSLSGSSSKINTISNFVHHKTDRTGEDYHRIYFGTDNDIHGQQTMSQFTEKARSILPKDVVNDRFHFLSSPYKKDWNDARQYYAQSDENARELDKKKIDFTADEFTDGLVSKHTQQMSNRAKEHLVDLNMNANHLYINYLNRDHHSNDSRYWKAIKRDDHFLNNANPMDTRAYKDFKQNIQGSFTPRELNRSLGRLQKRGMLWDTKISPLAKYQNMNSQQTSRDINRQNTDRTHRESMENTAAERAQRKRNIRSKMLKRQQYYKNHPNYNNDHHFKM